MQIETMKLNGITGEACIDKINQALSVIKGVDEITVSLAASKAVVQFDEDKTSLQELQATLTRAGYPVEGVEKKTDICCGGCGGSSHG